MAINPIFADSIDLPIVLVFGVIVLLPLLSCEVGIEALILKKVWHIPFRSLCQLTLIANCLSLLAGIPIKVLNACIYFFLLPGDLPGYFARYPLAVAAGTLIYFASTVGVEGAYAFRWLSRKGYKITPGRIWMGMFLANVASYAVVGPLNYFATRPQTQQIAEYRKSANWTSHPETKLIFVVMPNDGADGGANFYNLDSLGDLIVQTESGIGSYLEIYSATNRRSEIESLSVNPGLLHFAQFDFEDVAFLDHNECLFEANGYIYLLDIRNRRVGTVSKGGNFILLTPRYQKPLLPLPGM